jgi:hypothetical protein
MKVHKKYIQSAVASEMETFIRHLATARELWRRFPGLVEAEELPVTLESAAETNDVDLHGEYDPPADFAEPGFERQLWRYCRKEVIKMGAEEWPTPEEQSQVEQVNDADFLRSLGIEPEN